MDAKERYLAVYDDSERFKLDKVPKFVQYVREEFIVKHRLKLNFNLATNFSNMTYFSVPFELGFDAVFAPFPLSVKVKSVKIKLDNGEILKIGEDGQKIHKRTQYYEGGFIHSIEILDELRSNMKVVDMSKDIQKVVNNNEKFNKKIFPILMLDGIFDRVWKSMGIVQFSRHYRKNSNLYRELIKFYSEITELNLLGLVNATQGKTKIINILDDLAFKGRTFISPGRWKKDIMPSYKKITSLITDSGLIPQIHSDGDITELISLLQEAGFHGLQGWEGGCNPYYINDNFPDFVVIGFGDVSSILPYGSREVIINHVKDLMTALKENRHFVIGPSTVCHEKIPIENIQCFNLAAEKFGKYSN
jgi:hypothetical protein